MSIMELLQIGGAIAAVGIVVAAGLIKGKRFEAKQAEIRMEGQPSQGTESRPEVTRVVVTDINMSLDSMVIFMIKWVIASIPAAIILSILMFIILSAFGGMAHADAVFEDGALPAKIYIKKYEQYEPELEKAMRIQAKSPRCAKVSMGDVSNSKSKPGAPVFFVTCEDRSGTPFNTWYTLSDIENAAPKVAKNLTADQVREKCISAIKEKLNQPGSFSPHMLDYAAQDLPNGRTRARIGFTASNALGKEQDFAASCLVGPDLPAEVTIAEK
ncbi:hypothetical protein [Alloalcanivorax xenomutans]|uniref:hypothetical protein n=1 Tax=Alloalcanivorax xenomutans TaxID=1094342 RepID=UPI003BAD08CD